MLDEMDTVCQEEFEESEEESVIDSPAMADWAIEKIREIEERGRIFDQACIERIEYYKNKIEQNKKRTGDRTERLRAMLAQYIKSLPTKKNKTCETIDLPAGKVKLIYAYEKMEPNEKALIGKLEGTNYIKCEPALKWADYKKNLAIKDGHVIRVDTGEIEDAVSISTIPERVEIK